jgi:hypothetical protein
MDIKQKILMAGVKKEAYRFMKYCEKAKKLMLKADTKKKKETVNKYLDKAQKHHDKLINILNKSVTLINESNEEYYKKLIANADPNTHIQQIDKLEMFEHNHTFTKLIIEEDPLNSSEKAWEKLIKALSTYSTIFIDLIYTNSGHLKIINEALAEDRFKDCPEAVKSGVDTILQCLEIDADYISKVTFWDIVGKFIHFFTKFKDRRTLNKILSGKNLIELDMRIECITNYYSNDLEEAEKNVLNSLHSTLCDSIVNLLGILIVYNKLNPSKEALWAKEAIREWSKSYPSHKTSVLEEWENIEIPCWKKGKRYYIKKYQ